jgi:hypothetical protein
MELLRIPTLAEAEAVIGEPASKWVSRCYEIAYALVEKGLVPGRAVYGHYLGPVMPSSPFHDRHSACDFTGHGWVSLPDGRVLDPTRWVFEATEPYLYVGWPGEEIDPLAADLDTCLCGHLRAEHDSGFFAPCLACADDECEDFSAEEPQLSLEYDEGGNRWRERNLSPPPAFNPAAKRVELRLSPAAAEHTYRLLGGSPGVTVEQLLWLANLPLGRLGEQAQDVFTAIIEAGHAGFLPIDNRRRVLGSA